MKLLNEIMNMQGTANKFLSGLFVKVKHGGFYNDPSFESDLRVFIMIAAKLNQFEKGKINEQELQQTLTAYPGNQMFNTLLHQSNNIDKVDQMAKSFMQQLTSDEGDKVANTINKYALAADRVANKLKHQQSQQSPMQQPGERKSYLPQEHSFSFTNPQA